MNVTNDEQSKLWNGAAGRTWVEAQVVLDQMFQPIEDLLVKEAAALRPASVLDVGCGSGSVTLAVARALGEASRCVGADISDPLIVAARARAARSGTTAGFICGDAQVYAFERASFDLLISRFGVMFFDDPVWAFHNLRRAATDTAQLRLVAWRGAEENPFMTTAERAAAEYLPDIPARQPNAPGQFGFGERQHVMNILEQSGWTGIDIQPLDIRCTFPEPELMGYLSRLGPVGRILQEGGEETRTLVLHKIRAAFEPYVEGQEVAYTAACWMISARAA